MASSRRPRRRFAEGQEVTVRLPGRAPLDGTVERAFSNGTYFVLLSRARREWVSSVPEGWITPRRQEELPLTV